MYQVRWYDRNNSHIVSLHKVDKLNLRKLERLSYTDFLTENNVSISPWNRSHHPMNYHGAGSSAVAYRRSIPS
ncbi:hypothetical protein HID58_060142, partial [Brassica napus]